MALSAEELAKLEEKLKAIERLSDQLGANINTLNLRPIEENVGAIETLFNSLNKQARDLGENANYLASSFKNVLSEIRNSNTGIGELSKNLRGLSSISDKISQYQKGYVNLTSKDIIQLQNKTKIETNRLSITKSILQAEGIELARQVKSASFANESVAKQNKILKDLENNRAAQEAINSLLENQDITLKELNNELESSFNKAKKIEEVYGLSGAAVEGVNQALSKLGFGGLASQLGIDEAKSKMQALSDEIVSNISKEEDARKRLNILNNEATFITQQLNELGTKAVDTQNKLVDITEKLNQLKAKGDKANKDELSYYEKYKKELESQLDLERKTIGNLQSKNKIIQSNIAAESEELKTLQEFNKAHDGINGKLAVMKAGFSSMKNSIIKNLTDPLVVVGFLVTQIVDAFKIADSSAGDLAKQFDLTYTGANGVRMQLTDIANLSGDVALTTKGLQESMVAVGQSLGVNAMLNEADLKTFTKLREQAGFTNDELVGIQKLTLATGGNLEDNTKSFLGTVDALNAQNKLSINGKQLLKETANVSDAIKLSVGGTVKNLAEAAFKAKQFGINLQQADQIAESLLDFENSINNQISAELITGKALNLDKARLLALNGKVADTSAEILKQVGGTAEFTKMNRIQQEALAKAVGMTRDDLAKSLVDREAAAKLGAKEGESAQARYNELVKQYGVEKANAMLGDEALARQFQQQSIQERFAAAVEKLKEVFISLVEPLLPVLDVFAQIFKIVGPIAGVIGKIVGFVVDWGKYLLVPYGIIKGMQVVTKGMTALNTILIGQNATKLAQSQAEATIETTKLGLGGRILSMLGLQNAVRAYSLAQAVTGNTLTSLRIALEQTVLGKFISQGLNLGKNLIKYIALTVQAGYRAIFENTIVGAILRQGAGIIKNIALGAIELVQSMAIAAAKLMATSAATLGIGTAVAVAAAVAGYAVLKSMKGDDVMSEGGYGNRTLLTPKGSIALNNKDTVIAGTDLFGKKDEGSIKPAKEPTAPAAAPNINLAPLVEEFRAVKNEIIALREETKNTTKAVQNMQLKVGATSFGNGMATSAVKVQ